MSSAKLRAEAMLDMIAPGVGFRLECWRLVIDPNTPQWRSKQTVLRREQGGGGFPKPPCLQAYRQLEAAKDKHDCRRCEYGHGEDGGRQVARRGEERSGAHVPE